MIMQPDKKEVIINIVVFLLVYIAGLFLAGFFLNYNSGSDTRFVKYESKNLPILTVSTNDDEYNTLRGYTQDMDIRYMHEGLGVVSARSKVFTLNIYNFEDSNLHIDYVISSYDKKTVYGRKELDDIIKEDNYLVAKIPVDSLPDNEMEAMLNIVLYEKEKKAVNYYVRIKRGSEKTVKEYLSYIRKFVQGCIDKKTEIAKYIEPNGTDNNEDLSLTTINSSFKKFTYNSLKPVLVSSADITLLEMNDSVAMFGCRYVLNMTDDNNKSFNVKVEEKYRVKKGTDRVVLLNFERNINEEFGKLDAFRKNSISLGINSSSPNYISNLKGDKVCFLDNSELYMYDNSTGILNNIFISKEKTTYKKLFAGYKIKFLNMDENGSTDFLLYGYIDRGEHEGTNGVILYHFDSALNTTIERMVVKSDKSLAYLQKEIDTISYLSENNSIYLCLSNKLYEIDLSADGEINVILNKSKDSRLIASYDNRYVAYGMNRVEIPEYNDKMISGFVPFKKIILKNLSTGSIRKIEAKDGKAVIPVGFLKNDLVYATVRLKDAMPDSYGNIIVPAYEITVASSDGLKTMKKYKKKGKYISDIELKNSVIELYRVKKKNDTYIGCGNDRIVYSGDFKISEINVDKATLEDKGSIVRLVFPNRIIDNEKRISKSLLVADSKRTTFDVEPSDNEKLYNVFFFDKIIGEYGILSRAVYTASVNAAVVVSGNYGSIWSRSDYNMEALIDYDSLNEKYYKNQNISAINYADETVLDLRGCNVDDILYFIKQEKAVLAKGNNDENLLIVGFDEFNLIVRGYRNGQLSDEYYIGKNDSRALFEKNGNIFVCFI